MKDLIRHKIDEELTKSDIKDQISKFLDSSEFQSKVAKIVADRIKNEKGLEDKVVDITKNVMTQLYKTLWTKRSMWQGQLKNKAN
jgi:hypothetical protein